MKSKFCILPFLNLDVQPNGDVYTCCHSNNPQALGNLKESSASEVWNGEAFNTMRENFLNGKSHLNTHCNDCFYVESVGANSWRERENENWRKYYQEGLSGNLNLKTPLALALRFSNRCNFSCRICRPSTSTAWFQDAKLMNPKGEYLELTSASEDNPLSSQIEGFIDELVHVNMSGGEPLLNDDHYLVLDKIIKKNNKVMISYDSNLSFLKYKSFKVLDYWNKLETVIVSGSLDGYGTKGEYLRKGLDWEHFLKNWNIVRKEAPHVELRIKFTLNIYNMFHVLEFIEEVNRLGMFNDDEEDRLHIGIVEDPPWLSLQALPKNVKKIVEDKYRNFLITNSYGRIRKDLESAIHYMNGEDKSRLLPGFRGFTKQLDMLRGESFFELFPEESKLLFDSKG